ncbi:MAG: kelch repeat-containing protein [bacterium]|nr:kelch repeat-containing protein [bacterium]
MLKSIKFVFALLFCGNVAYGAGRWSLTTGSLNTARSGGQSVMLTDSKVMAFGGMSSNALVSYETFDPATGKWQAASYDTALYRNDHTTAVLLPDGNVLLETDRGYLWNYNPQTKLWRNTGWYWQTDFAGSMQECWNLLYDGRVLFVDHPGGITCYIYEWNIDTLRRIADNIDGTSGLYTRFHSAEVRLPNGTVMLMGGWTLAQQIYKSCEIFNPVSETFSYTDSLLTGLVKHVAVLLRTTPQKVLTAGGNTTVSQLYDVVTQKWSYSGATQNVSPRLIPALALLPNGKALLIGGAGLNTCEIYNPETDQWTITDPMTVERWHFVATILPTGKVLAHGEYNTGGDIRTEIYDPAEGAGWSSQTPLNTARCAATTTLLPTNILISGGEDAAGTALNSCELFNYQKNTTTATGSLSTARTHHTANLTIDLNGKVFVTGGKNGGGALSSCEMYSSVGEAWTTTASMSTQRFDHTSTLLKDGTIFVTGGENSMGYTNTCEIFNGNIWTLSAGTMSTARARHTAVLLLDGRVMVIGGETSAGTPTTACQIYDPITAGWAAVPSLDTARSWHSAVLLQSGKILVIGGKDVSGTALATCEIYDPTTNLWSMAGSLNTARYLHNATMTYAGLVMVSGGNPGPIASCELYDPATNKWTNTGAFTSGRSYHSTVLVPDIKPFVYAIGGNSGSSALSSIERFDFGLGYQAGWQSKITNYPSITPISSTMNIEGSLFRDITEADGGNHCHASNTDHPIISLVRIGGGNFQGNGGGDIITMPSSSYWDTSHTTVHPQVSDFYGYYRLWSIVNGIPCKWEKSIGIEEPSNPKSNPKSKIQNLKLDVSQNPFSKSTVITYHLSELTTDPPQAEPLTTLCIYDLSGRCVKTLVNGEKPAGSYSTTLNAQDLKTGIYFVKLTVGNTKETKKITIIR